MWKGEAFSVSISSAPACTAASAAPGSQTSAQIASPQRTPFNSTTQGVRPAAK
jgi:hypothetical protein